jgi:hypothetical protein
MLSRCGHPLVGVSKQREVRTHHAPFRLAAGVYHLQPHATLKVSSLEAWRAGIASMSQPIRQRMPRRFTSAFCPTSAVGSAGRASGSSTSCRPEGQVTFCMRTVETAERLLTETKRIRGELPYLTYDTAKLSLLPVFGDRLSRIYARAATPPVPPHVLLTHSEYRQTKSLFGVLFEVQRPNLPGCLPGAWPVATGRQNWDAD